MHRTDESERFAQMHLAYGRIVMRHSLARVRVVGA